MLVSSAATSCQTSTQPSMVVNGGPFACGPELTCDSTKHYCSVFYGGPAGVPPSYACADLPKSAPPPPTCESIPSQLGCTCTESDDRITVTCRTP